MQSVVLSIPQVGCLLQWSADTTEHAHIKVVKDSASMTNHHDYDAQICCTLDHDEKCHLFATVIHLQTSQNHDPGDLDIARLNGNEEPEGDHDVGNVSQGDILGDLWSAKCQSTDFFKVAANVANESTVVNSLPPWTIIAGSIAIHLNIELMHHCQSIDEVTEEFGLPDLCGALADYMRHEGQPHRRKIHTFSGPRRSGPDVGIYYSVFGSYCLPKRSYIAPFLPLVLLSDLLSILQVYLLTILIL